MDDNGIFDDLLQAKPLFKNREVLRLSYTPERLPHRKAQINHLASVLVAALRGETPSNVFIYGKTGTGKTAVANFVGKELEKKAKELERSASYIYINCQHVDTQYRVLTHIANYFTKRWSDRLPLTGWPTDEVYSKLIEYIDNTGGVTTIVLDEIDKLVSKSGDDLLYNLSRINEDLHEGRVSIIGISNDLKFTEFLDARVKSSLGEEELIFPPYNAEQLCDILQDRAKLAFHPGILDHSVVRFCAALAAQEHGDARRALDLLRVSADLAERDGVQKIEEKYVRAAQNKIELDRVSEVIRTLPPQSQLVLIGIMLNEESGKVKLTTGEVYDSYRELAKVMDMNVLTQRRVTDLISELDMLGIINARLISKGRYGRTREIELSVSRYNVKRVIRDDDRFRTLIDYRLKIQSRLV